MNNFDFREKPISSTREYVKTWNRLKAILYDRRYRVMDLFFEDKNGKSFALVTYCKESEDLGETTMHNAVIGAHVTTFARHSLLNYLNQVLGRSLYW